MSLDLDFVLVIGFFVGFGVVMVIVVFFIIIIINRRFYMRYLRENVYYVGFVVIEYIIFMNYRFLE